MEPTRDDQYEEARQAARDAARAARDTARSARAAARHARRVHHYEFGRRWHSGAPWFFGTLLVSLGVLFLLHNLRLVNASLVLRNLFPSIVLAWGLSRVIFGVHAGEKVFGAVAAFFGGAWLAQRYLDLDINIAGLFWPLLLIGIGLSMLFRPRRRGFPPFMPFPPPGGPAPGGTSSSSSFGGSSSGPSSFGASSSSTGGATAFDQPGEPAADGQPSSTEDDVYEDGAATIREYAFLSGIERRNISQVFRGGALTTMMGAIELDLRDCRMAGNSATILVQVIMGQISLRLPQGWTVESRVGAVLGNVEDRSDRPVESAPKRLVIEGTVFMGQVEIRN